VSGSCSRSPLTTALPGDAVEGRGIRGVQTEQPEDLGLSIAEGKTLMAAVQQRVVDPQLASWAESALQVTHCCADLCS
jgi:hypothetical protein